MDTPYPNSARLSKFYISAGRLIRGYESLPSFGTSRAKYGGVDKPARKLFALLIFTEEVNKLTNEKYLRL